MTADVIAFRCCRLAADFIFYQQELDAFLKTEGSTNTGLAKADGSGEAIGHESGRKIVDILKRNPSKVRRLQSTQC